MVQYLGETKASGANKKGVCGRVDVDDDSDEVCLSCGKARPVWLPIGEVVTCPVRIGTIEEAEKLEDGARMLPFEIDGRSSFAPEKRSLMLLAVGRLKNETT